MKIKMLEEGTGTFNFAIVSRECAGDRYDSLASLSVRDYPPFLWIAGLYVPKGLRRQGYARRLLERALAFAGERYEDRPVYIDALPFADQPVSQTMLFLFYYRHGFRRVPGHPYSMRRGS